MSALEALKVPTRIKCQGINTSQFMENNLVDVIVGKKINSEIFKRLLYSVTKECEFSYEGNKTAND